MTYEFKFSNQIPSYFSLHGDRYYRLQGADREIMGSRSLFYAGNASSSKALGPNGISLDNGEWFATGTFRNSLFIEPWSKLSRVGELSLMIEYEGALRLKVMRAISRHPPDAIEEVTLFSEKKCCFVVNLGSIDTFSENSRLFWHVDGLAGGGTIYDVAYCSSSVPVKQCRLLVAMRTFGRTSDVKGLLKKFADIARKDPYYSAILDNIEFWVLDTTTDCETEYDEDWLQGLNLRVLVGPNLGGGGNAGHSLQLLEDACRDAALPPTELLILDDDLSVSMESIARYYMLCAYRLEDFICSLPVIMKSRPTVMWEDGGFWGRLNEKENGSLSRKRSLFPTLLKHGLQLNGFDYIDDFNPLNTCEYSTFIFYGMSMKTFRKVGFPTAFFLRGDDVELSLRAQELGVSMITNPNLCAWHEPAHSYGQEYMAILHGVIINLTYGEHGADFYTRFFEERLYEHASINDLVGMKLYRDIVAELVDPESQVLTNGFQSHYLARLKQLGAIRSMRLPNPDIAAFERRARESNVLVVPFVYPGYQKDISRYRSIVVINHSARTFREIPASSFAEKAALNQEFVALIGELEAGFDKLRERWQQRLKEASASQFWQGIVEQYATQTRDILNGKRQSSDKTEGADDVLTHAVVTDVARIKSQKTRSSVSTAKSAASPARLQKSSGAATGSLAAANTVFAQSAIKPSLGAAADRLPEADKAMRGKGALAFSADAAELGIDEEATAFSEQDASGDSLPIDFDPDIYLHINSDVQGADVDAATHYLQWGRKENRRYRL